MHDHRDEPLLGPVRGAEEEEVQEVPRSWRGGGRGERPLPRQQPGQREGERDDGGQEREQVTQLTGHQETNLVLQQ